MLAGPAGRPSLVLRGGRDAGGRRLLLCGHLDTVSTVLYGPEGEGAHADVEWVSRNGTLIATGVLTTLARDFCR